MDKSSVVATYWLESFYSLEQAAEILAGEQSTGTFVRVPGESDKLKWEFGAKVLDIDSRSMVEGASLPGASRPGGTEHGSKANAGIVKIEFPIGNFGPSIPNLLAATAGNLFELRELAGIRLLDLDIPDIFKTKYLGPQFGVSGTRRLMGVNDDLLIGTIIKPSVGMRPDDLRPIVRELVDSGIDFIKDDELIASPSYSPLSERVRVVMDEIHRGAERTGKMVMYAFNITDDIDNLMSNHDVVVKAGGNCVMVCPNMIGFTGVSYLRKRSQLPIHAHRAMIGAIMRHPSLGMGFGAYQKLARLAGIDHLHTSGLNNKFYETNEEVIQSVRSVQEPFLGGNHILPVLSSAQWAGSVAPTYETLKTKDLLMLAGGGIHAHPGGRMAGVASMKLAWEAVAKGIQLETFALRNKDLQEAIDKFGGNQSWTR